MPATDPYPKRIALQRRRIDALRNAVAMPGHAARSGLSTRIAAIEDRHRRTSADYVRLTSTPESEADWRKLRERLDRALEEVDARLDAAEASAPARPS